MKRRREGGCDGGCVLLCACVACCVWGAGFRRRPGVKCGDGVGGPGAKRDGARDAKIRPGDVL